MNKEKINMLITIAKVEGGITRITAAPRGMDIDGDRPVITMVTDKTAVIQYGGLLPDENYAEIAKIALEQRPLFRCPAIGKVEHISIKLADLAGVDYDFDNLDNLDNWSVPGLYAGYPGDATIGMDYEKDVFHAVDESASYHECYGCPKFEDCRELNILGGCSEKHVDASDEMAATLSMENDEAYLEFLKKELGGM